MNTSLSQLPIKDQIDMIVFDIVRQGLNLRIINESRNYPVSWYIALKNIVILDSQEEQLKTLFRVKTAYKKRSIKTFPKFQELFIKETGL